jgi:hypothetical protein
VIASGGLVRDRLRASIYAAIEHAALAGEEATFNERHMRLIDKYTEQPQWKRVTEPSQINREVRGIVRRAFKLPAKLEAVK